MTSLYDPAAGWKPSWWTIDAQAAYGIALPRCPRCNMMHRGLCGRAITRTDAYALGKAGISEAQTEKAQHSAGDHHRARALVFLDGIVTASGRRRDVAVAVCGRVCGGLLGRQPVLYQRRCGDRGCPACARIRAARLGGDLTEAMAHRERGGKQLYELTLTQVKPFGSDPTVAHGELVSRWRRFTNTKTRTGRTFRDRHTGCYRAIELTWSPKGKRNKHGGATRYDGWHAHLHCIIEAEGLQDVQKTAREWADSVGGSYSCCHASRVEDGYAHELAKYVVKPMEEIPDEYGAALYRALHGKRMVQPLGAWRYWRQWLKQADGQDADKPTLMVGAETVAQLYRRHLAGDTTYTVATRDGKTELADLGELFDGDAKWVG
jgi:hypothetical protein